MAVRFDVKFETAAATAALNPVFDTAATDMIAEGQDDSSRSLCLILSKGNSKQKVQSSQ